MNSKYIKFDSDVEFVLYPERARRRRFLRRLKLLAILAGSLAAIVFFFSNESKTFESVAISQQISQLSGLNIKVDKHSLGIGILELSGVSLSGRADGSIARVLTTFNLNPFRGRFGSPDEVTLGDFSMQLTPKSFSSLISNRRRNAKDYENSASNLPRRIRLEGGNIGFSLGEAQPVLTLAGIKGRIDTIQEYLEIQAKSLRFDNIEVDQNVTAKIRRNESGSVRIEISRRADEETHWWIKAMIGGDLRFAKLEYDLASLSPTLAKVFEKYVVDSQKLRLNGRATIRMVANSDDQVEIDWESHARNWSIMVPELSRGAVMLPPTHAVAKVFINAATQAYSVPTFILALDAPQKSKLNRGQFVRFHGSAIRSRDQSWKFAIELPESECGNLLGVIPRDILEDVSELKLRGKIGFSAELTIGPKKLELNSLVPTGGGINCDAESVPERFSKNRLRYSQTFEIGADGRHRINSESAAKSPGFVELDRLPDFLVKAFVHSEDRRFFEHQGFDLEGIRQALSRNFARGAFKMGGSTITQQLVKNLFFTNERTVGRKIRESIITWYVERYLNKQRILELYLNVVEFGPGVFGIANAAKFYFEKSPEQVSPREAAYLAYLLPAPIPRFQQTCMGAYRPAIDRAVTERLNLLEKAKWISGDVAYRGKTENLHFSRSSAIQSRCNFESKGRVAGSRTKFSSDAF